MATKEQTGTFDMCISELVKLKVPITPNFIIGTKGRKYCISDFNEDQLRSIGELMTNQMICRARTLSEGK